MSIVEPGSVLILGAGSSCDFGLPLGGQLIDLIKGAAIEKTYTTSAYGDRISHPSYWDDELLRPREGLRNPIGAIALHQFVSSRTHYLQDDRRKMRQEVFDFGNALGNQTSDTIDDFISLNPKHAVIAKQCIAAIFAEKIFDTDRHGSLAKPKDFGARTFGAKGETRNWIHLLINIARHHYRASKPHEKIKIISFNYEGILERVLAKQFANVEESFGPYTDYFEIVHPHGYCGDVLDSYDNIWKALTEWAANIWVVNEPPALLPAKVVEARARARELIQEAEHIYAAGFAFARPNCKLLGLNERDRVKITYHNFNNDIGVDLAVESISERWGMRSSQLAQYIRKGAGSEGRPLTIADWIRAGYLGEMPG